MSGRFIVRVFRDTGCSTLCGGLLLEVKLIRHARAKLLPDRARIQAGNAARSGPTSASRSTRSWPTTLASPVRCTWTATRVPSSMPRFTLRGGHNRHRLRIERVELVRRAWALSVPQRPLDLLRIQRLAGARPRRLELVAQGRGNQTESIATAIRASSTWPEDAESV